MFKLFSNIFEHPEPDHFKLPKALLKEAIERTVDGTDPRLRLLPGYAKKLRDPVLHAAEHVVGLVKSLPKPVPLNSDCFVSDPALATIFYSNERLQETLNRDVALREFRKSTPFVNDSINALLAVHKVTKRVVGTTLVNGTMRRDVAQTTVSFDHRWFVDPCQSEEETQRMLMRRVFDRLLGIALTQIMERENERKDLSVRKALVKSKLDVLGRSGSLNDQPIAAERNQLQSRMVNIEQQLAALGPDDSVLPTNLATIAAVLGSAERQLWIDDTSLCLDSYYVLHKEPSPAAPKISFKEFKEGEHDGILVLMVKLALDYPSGKQAIPFSG